MVQASNASMRNTVYGTLGAAKGITLGELAVRFGCVLQGDPAVRVTCVSGLHEATAEAVSFVANRKYRRYLAETHAGVVILEPQFAGECKVPALLAKNPYAVYARVATLLYPAAPVDAGVHPTAVVDASAKIDATASIGPHCVVGSNVRIGARAVLGPASIVMRDASIDADTRLVARVTIGERVSIGARGIFHPGVVIGADGFGMAPEAGSWVKVPQLGSVRIGDDVEVGANTTIDRGAIGDTIIEDDVKLDNQIQIGHNVRVGAHTAMAAGVGIAGSTTIGKHCLIAGKVGITGQIEICDGVIINGHSTVSGSIRKPGTYAGALGLEESNQFRRNAARFRQLDDMAKQLRRLSQGDMAAPNQTDDEEQ